MSGESSRDTLNFDMRILLVEPNRRDPFEDASDYQQDDIDFDVGVWTRDTVRLSARTRHSFVFTCFDRSELMYLREFFDSRLGRHFPFWIPSWNRDVTLWGDHVGGTDTLVINDIGFASHCFPDGISARQRLAVSKISGGARVWENCVVTSAADNGNGSETLQLQANLAMDLTVEEADICFLLYVRFDSDTLTIPWYDEETCEIAVSVVEMPPNSFAIDIGIPL